MSSFLADLQELANPAPKGVLVDEDDLQDVTRAKVVDKADVFGASTEDLPGNQSKLPGGKLSQKIGRKVAISLADSDPKYAGNVVSRSDLFDSDLFDGEEQEIESDVSILESDSKLQAEIDENSDEEIISEEDDEGLEKSKTSEISVEEPDISRKIDLVSERQKGEAVKNQLALWDKLLGLRIRMQKVCGLVNRLPQTSEGWRLAKLESEGNSHARAETSQDLIKCRKSVKSTLDKLMSLQNTLYANSPELSKVQHDLPKKSESSNRKRKRQNSSEFTGFSENEGESDEEILSSPDEADPTDSGLDLETSEARRKKRKKTSYDDLPKVLHRRHENYRRYRNEVLMKWFERTRLASGRFSAKKDFSGFEINVLKQIDQILSNKFRLISRTQTKRSEYEILGKEKTSANGLLDEKKSEDLDPEIFDDDDFYQHLLRELIDRKSSTTTDSSILSRQWLEMQKLRNKAGKKKTVDTRATKARKVRYDVHQKLLHFMAPLSHGSASLAAKNTDSIWREDSKTELFGSLFGGSSD